MITRREFAIRLAAGATLVLRPGLLQALAVGSLIQRAIPSSGEKVPVIGLGSSATFSQAAQSGDTGLLKAVMQTLIDRGATVFDTAPGYGASEQVAGDIANELGVAQQIFWATKVNVVPRQGGKSDSRSAPKADPAAARAQIQASFDKFRVPVIDLIQVHNLADVPTQLGILKELKAEGRVRYIGVTSTRKQQYEYLQQVMRDEPLDFIGIDYAIDNREVEESILPLAEERKIAVMVYVPFGRASLFQKVRGQALPDWAHEFDATTWAQFFLKYVVSHPAVTVVTPATSQATHMADDIAGGIGRLPDLATRKRMVEWVDALPPVR